MMTTCVSCEGAGEEREWSGTLAGHRMGRHSSEVYGEACEFFSKSAGVCVKHRYIYVGK